MSTEISYKIGDSDERPWGRWEVVDVAENHIVKRIRVNPGEILSLQYHHHRNEHWVIVQGTATVTLGDEIIEKNLGESVYIPVTTPHRVANKSTGVMEFVEVQTGTILDENDIVRLEDNYGRVE